MAKAHTDRSLQLSNDERMQLESLAASRSLPAALVRRAKIILLTEDGMSDREAARRLSVAQPTVSMWRRRFRAGRLSGLHDELKSGRPRSHEEDQLAQLLNIAVMAVRGQAEVIERLVAIGLAIHKATRRFRFEPEVRHSLVVTRHQVVSASRSHVSGICAFGANRAAIRYRLRQWTNAMNRPVEGEKRPLEAAQFA